MTPIRIGLLRARLHLCILAVIPFLFVTASLPLSSRAQDNPSFRIEEDITRFAYSTGGRIAFATRHIFSVKKFQMQRDDIWISEPDGKKHRILLGEKFVRGSGAFSYTVRGLRWSPDGSKLTAELGTSEVINDAGETQLGVMTLLLDDTGKEIKIEGADSVIVGASNAAWLADGATVAYLTEQKRGSAANPSSNPPPSKIFTMNRVKPFAGGGDAIFQGRLFSAVAWNTKQNLCVAIEGGQNMTEPPRLVVLDLLHETSRPLGTLESYVGGLVISPSGRSVAYWITMEQLELRDLANPNRLARVRVGPGSLAWSADEARVLVKRGPAPRSSDLVWVRLPPMVVVATGATPTVADVVPESILHGLQFRLFDISPGGKSLAVVEPGKRNLLVYPLP
jgi:hypothetical protein